MASRIKKAPIKIQIKLKKNAPLSLFLIPTPTIKKGEHFFYIQYEESIYNMNKRIHLLIKGKVQGVWYRLNTKKKADELGIKGYAKNLPNGDVEVVAEGPKSKLKQLLEYCRRGPELARVDKVEAKWLDPINEFSDFFIKG